MFWQPFFFKFHFLIAFHRSLCSLRVFKWGFTEKKYRSLKTNFATPSPWQLRGVPVFLFLISRCLPRLANLWERSSKKFTFQTSVLDIWCCCYNWRSCNVWIWFRCKVWGCLWESSDFSSWGVRKFRSVRCCYDFSYCCGELICHSHSLSICGFYCWCSIFRGCRILYQYSGRGGRQTVVTEGGQNWAPMEGWKTNY